MGALLTTTGGYVSRLAWTEAAARWKWDRQGKVLVVITNVTVPRFFDFFKRIS